MPNNNQDDMPMTEQTASVYSRLRRLQEYSRSNIMAMVTHRTPSTFNLHAEPPPTEAGSHVLIVVYPQDPFVGEPAVRVMETSDISPGLINSRVSVVDDSSEIAEPGEDGNYMFWPGTPQFDQVNSFYYTTFVLRMYERYAQRMLPWAFPSPRISINPHAGTDANAFYSERDRLLGFHAFNVNGKTISTTHSADIVSHEAAHAVLDGMRDLYNESFGLGPTAFHESFGDITAVLVALHDDSLVRRLLSWTDGDLHRDNFVAAVAEQLAHGLDQTETTDGRTVYLRNAINNLTFLPFDDLPEHPDDPDIELGRDIHNYSRLFTGTFYDILAAIYDKLKSQSHAHIAVYQAREISARMLICAIELGPVGEFDFTDMARAFLAADNALFDAKYRSILIDVFKKRKLLSKTESNKFLEQIDTLPKIKIPATINSALSAAMFLENEIMPALNIEPDGEFIPLTAYRNAGGQAYITYLSSRTIVLDGKQYQDYDGTGMDLFGGLTLMFDDDDNLRSAFYRPISDEDIRQVKVMTLDLIKQGLIADASSPQHIGAPQGLFLSNLRSPGQDSDLASRLVKFPVTFDNVTKRTSDFVDYLEKVKSKTGHG
jgi:hypothetical protein